MRTRTAASGAGTPGVVVEADGLSVDREAHSILTDISFVLCAGEVHGLVGRNGSGKSTLIQVLAGLIAAGGRLERSGPASLHNELPGWHPRRSLRQHVRILRGEDHVRGDVLDDLVERFDLSRLLDRAPRAMSLGQQRGVSLLAPLSSRSPLLLLDEPFLALDADRVATLERVIVEQARQGRAVVVSSHAPEPLQKVATHALRLDAGTLTFRGRMRDLLRATRPAAVRLRTADPARWVRAAAREWPHTRGEVVASGEVVVGDVSMAQALALARREDLELSGIWEDVPTLREILIPEPAEPTAAERVAS